MSGVRVVRSPHWECGDEDGGEGFVGTLVWQEEGIGRATVQWDTANRHSYRCGDGGKCDLRVLDTGPAGVQHSGLSCNWCSVCPITGSLWQCVQCYMYALCSQCYHSGKHCLEHEFERVDGTENQRVRVGGRLLARRVMSRGMFKGAVVMRGADWRWDDQDGGIGCRGEIEAIDGWEQTTFRSVVHVAWSHSQTCNIYCVGHNGLVDLQCVEPASGGLYYPDHLQILGGESSGEVVGGGEVRAGDGVRVELDPGLFKAAQEDHGGWEDYMAEYIGCNGVALAIHSTGDAVVRYKNGTILQINRDCLTKLEGPGCDCGDVVRVCDDMAEVHRLQKGHGEWADDMALSLGLVGRVLKVRGNGDVRVAVNGSRWILNPHCLSPAPGEVPIEEKTGQLHVDITVRVQTLSMSEAACADVVVVAAAGGDLDTLVKYLKYHPEHVDALYEGKGAIHMASLEGYLPILRLLISHRANLNKKDDGGSTALHFCVAINSVEATKLLLDGGADMNIGDERGVVPLAMAAALGHAGIVNLLLGHSRTDPNIPDNQGNTALHRAVFGSQLHGVEELMKWYPDLINKPRKDGYTPLHIVAANRHTDILTVLASHPRCDLNVEDSAGLTPLHLAVLEGHPVIIERLVGYGADLNSATSEGNTALHLTFKRKNMAAPSHLSPHILEVKRELDGLCGQETLLPNIVVGVFLAREGANILAANKLGFHPLSLHPPDLLQLVTRYSTTTTDIRNRCHGKLRQTESPFANISPKTPLRSVTVMVAEQRSSPVTPTTTTPTSPSPSISTPSSSSQTHSTTSPHRSTSSAHHQASTASTQPQASRLRGGQERRKGLNGASVNEHTPSPVLTYQKDINPYAKLAAASAIDSAASGVYKLEQCSLCEEEPVSIMLQPCGHVLLCILCGSRARRCMKKECRAEVMNIIQLCPVCLKNQAHVTHTACTKEHHKLCRGCLPRSSAECILCSSVILKAPEYFFSVT